MTSVITMKHVNHKLGVGMHSRSCFQHTTLGLQGRHIPALHAICGFRMQRDPKGNRLPFVIAPKVIWALLANCQRVTEHRMQYTFIFADLLGFAGGSWYPFAFFKKESDTFWSRNKRGQVTLSNKVTRVFSFICYINQFLPWKQIQENEEKFWK